MTTSPKKSGPRGINWAIVEQLYVHGEDVTAPSGALEHVFPSYAVLAKRFGVRTEMVARKGTAAHWTEKRRAFVGAVHGKVRRICLESAVKSLADQMAFRMRVADTLLDEMKAFITKRTTPDANGKTIGLDADDFNKLSSALKRLVETRRIELGLSPPESSDDEPAVEDPFVRTAVRESVKQLLNANSTPREDASPHDDDTDKDR